MDVYQAIESRHSVRSFQDRPVDDAVLGRLLTAAQGAPSGRNLQEWKLVVLREAELRAQLAAVCDQSFMAGAPVVLALVATNPDRMMFCGVSAAPVDGAIVLDHLSLAAASEGLGTCWIGHFDQDATRKLLAVPPSCRIIELMLLGYPDRPAPARRRKAIDHLICYERYQ